MAARSTISCLPCALLLVAITFSAHADRVNGFDLSNPLVPRKLIRAGGPPRDGIPAIDTPRFISAGDARDLRDTERVLGVTIDGLAKAYPVKILNYHEIVNDRFGDLPVAVTFCPLCGSGVAFDARVNGEAREFGVSGLLYNSDVLMYDRESDSLWSQILGQAVTGAARGTELRTVPVRHTTWAEWRGRHPATLVLAEPRFTGRNYNVNPYVGYAESARLWAPVAHRDKRYPAKAVVVGAVVNGEARAWPFAELHANRSFVTESVAGQNVRLEYDHDAQAASLLDEDGQEIPSFTAFWFAWVAFHPDTSVYTGG